MTGQRTPSDRDQGSILVLAVILVVVLGMVAMAIAAYVGTSFTSVRVTKDRTNRLAAAEAGLTVAIDRLSLRQTLCTSGAAASAFEIVVPAPINGATVRVTCRRSGSLLTDVQGWAAIVTGEGIPLGTPLLTTAGSVSDSKRIGGPVYIVNKDRMGLGPTLEIVDGDLWYLQTGCNSTPTDINIPRVVFTPEEFRGPICTAVPWRTAFTANEPPLPPLPAITNPAADTTSFPGCKVFFPGIYTTAPDLAAQNFFVSGDYYLNIGGTGLWQIRNQAVIAGVPAGAAFNDEIISSGATNCIAAANYYGSLSAERGATFVMGGRSHIEVAANGSLEILRRPQGGSQSLLSIIAVTPENIQPGYTLGTITGHTTPIVWTQSGNTSDLIIHGLMWAPYSRAVLDNVTNVANGQLLGGVIVAKLDIQSSASANAFNISVQSSPQQSDVLLTSVATDGRGNTTTVRAVVQYNPDSGNLAINSWRVVPSGEL